MRDIMRLSKEELRREISSRQDSMEELQEEQFCRPVAAA
jgi:hypothetical protein